jgi:hypothetical protein
MNVVVDRERLAWELEEGIDAGGYAWLYPREYILRNPVCGLTSASIARHLNDREVPTMLVKARVRLPKLDTEHALPLIVDHEPHAIDACATQFLDIVGLSWGYAVKNGEDVYPADKIFDFKLSRIDEIIDWLTNTADQFRDREPKLTFKILGRTIGEGPMSVKPKSEIRDAYSSIYNPSIFREHVPSPAGQSAAMAIAKYITAESIQIS